MLIEPLEVPPGAPTVLGRRRTFSPKTYWIDTSRSQGEQRFETHLTFPVGAKVVHIAEPLTAMEGEVPQPNTARRGPTAAVFLAMDMKTVQMLIAPGEQDLQDRMQVCQGGMAVHQHATPDEWAYAAQDEAELIDAEWCSSGSHALRVAQRSVPLKRSPRYLALSLIIGARVIGKNPGLQVTEISYVLRYRRFSH